MKFWMKNSHWIFHDACNNLNLHVKPNLLKKWNSTMRKPFWCIAKAPWLDLYLFSTGKKGDTTINIFLTWIYASAHSYVSLSESAICSCVLTNSLNHPVNKVILSPAASQPTVTYNSSKTKWQNCTAWWWAQEN